jgi:hypothetical protein
MSDHVDGPAQEPEAISYREMRSSVYLTAEDLKNKPRVAKALKVTLRGLLDEKGAIQTRGVVKLDFTKFCKDWILNVTNAVCCEAMFGADPRAMVGKRITLAPEMDRLQGKPTMCVRVVGSPDIDKDFDCTIKLPRKTAKVKRLTKTVL